VGQGQVQVSATRARPISRSRSRPISCSRARPIGRVRTRRRSCEPRRAFARRREAAKAAGVAAFGRARGGTSVSPASLSALRPSRMPPNGACRRRAGGAHVGVRLRVENRAVR
jgi:hypothetical protein